MVLLLITLLVGGVVCIAVTSRVINPPLVLLLLPSLPANALDLELLRPLVRADRTFTPNVDLADDNSPPSTPLILPLLPLRAAAPTALPNVLLRINGSGDVIDNFFPPSLNAPPPGLSGSAVDGDMPVAVLSLLFVLFDFPKSLMIENVNG